MHRKIRGRDEYGDGHEVKKRACVTHVLEYFGSQFSRYIREVDRSTLERKLAGSLTSDPYETGYDFNDFYLHRYFLGGRIPTVL